MNGESIYPIPTLPYLRFRFALRAEREAQLPAFKGSLLRGAFGHALRRLVCTMGPNQACELCPHRRTCIHTRLFETFVEGEPPPFLKGLTTAPRPFVVEPRDSRRHYRRGELLHFDLILVGNAAGLQSHAVDAVREMARGGLGRRRYPFRLQKATHQVGDGGFQSWNLEETGPAPPLVPVLNGIEEDRATLRFLTPTRLKIRGRITDQFNFRSLSFKMLSRVLELVHFYHPEEEVDWNFRSLLECADRVRVVDPNLRWMEWRRRRGGRPGMHLGGFVGTVEVRGDLRPFHRLLRTTEVVHLGKGATFGLGKVELE